MQGLSDVFTRVGRTIQARPGLTLLVALVLVGGALVGAMQIQSVTGAESFVGDDPTLDQFSESFDRGTVATLVRGDVTNPGAVRAIDRYDRRLSSVDHVERVVSPADRVREAYGYVPDSQAAIERVLDDRSTAVVQVVLEPGLSQPETRPLYEKATDARDWAAFPGGVTVTVTGNAAFSAQLNELISQSTSQLLSLAVGLMIVALFFLFRGVRLRLLPIVAVFTGVVWTFGAIGFAGVPNSTLTSAVFPILIGLGIDYSVQFHERYEEELEDAPPRTALPRALGGIGPPVLVAMLAAALGFGATWLSSVGTPAFVWFAQTSIFGVLLTFLAGILVLLPLLTLYVRWKGDDEASGAGDGAGAEGAAAAVDDGPGGTTAGPSPEPPAMGPHPVSAGDSPAQDPDSDEIGRFGRVLGRSTRLVASRPLVVLALATLLMLGGFHVASDLGTMADTEEFFPQDLPAYVDLQQFRSATGGGASTQFDVLVSGDALRQPETLRWLSRFQGVAEGRDLVSSVQSPATLVRQYNDGTIPQTAAGVERVLERVPAAQRQRVYADGYAHVVVDGERRMNNQELLDFLDSVETSIAMSQPPPRVDAELTGTAAIATPSIVQQIEGRNLTTALGIAFVFGALLLYYRRPLRAVAPLIPMVFVVGWQNLYMAALSIPISPLGAGLGAMSVGIGAEYTIIVMERYFEERERDVSRLDAMETAGARVGKAISVSGMTTVFGFSALTLSPFPVLADFGYLTVGVILLTLVAALATLPPTLVALGRLGDAVDRWDPSTLPLPT